MDHDSGVSRRRRRFPLIVLAVLVCSAVGTSVVVGSVIDDQEHRLLEERTREASALLSSSFGQLTSTLPLIGAVATVNPSFFDLIAPRFIDDDGGAMGIATPAGDGFVVTAAAGDGPAVGETLPDAHAAFIARALTADGPVTDIVETGSQRRVAFAVATGIGDGVIYSELGFDIGTFDNSGAESPFSELVGAVYASSEADPDRLVFATTSDLPITGEVVQQPLEIGADEWTVVAKTRRPLVGSFANRSPWYVLGVGLLTAVLVTALAEILSRRRIYALALVDERTAELREALAEKERLEEGQRMAREAAEEANRSKSEFLSRMSHELRTPLNAVLGFAQLLEMEDLAEADHDSVKQILKGGRHLLDLINEVLDITRIETGTFQLSPEPVLASEVLADVVELTAPLAAQAGIELISSGTLAETDHVLADRQRLKQILLNLVANAIKYNRPGGTVTLSCESVGDGMLRINVEDTGPGIRPEHVGLLFTPFERLGAEQTAVEGTGIGLALSRRLAEAMGCTLDLETTPGTGTTFWVELRVVEGPVARYERLTGATDPIAPEPRSDIKTVLYIEDNVANLSLVQRILARNGDIELVSAMRGQEGVELAREHQPALILLDLHLPDIGGDEVLRLLREDPRTASIPVVVVSADATAGQMHHLLDEGARAYLTKPIDVGELRGVVESLPSPRP